ncbi:hypothetical protein SynPROSU1_02086 [Synechococcus sp. PROS-U-1]|nr:hypothetical protein SynPROSU1_02086 [Synechococcus sp. PROS-U-1]
MFKAYPKLPSRGCAAFNGEMPAIESSNSPINTASQRSWMPPDSPRLGVSRGWPA